MRSAKRILAKAAIVTVAGGVRIGVTTPELGTVVGCTFLAITRK